MKVKIERERWTIVRKEFKWKHSEETGYAFDENECRIPTNVSKDFCEILCGLARNFEFKKFDEIGNTSIKTFMTKNKAEASFTSSWGNEMLLTGMAKAIKVKESLEEIE